MIRQDEVDNKDEDEVDNKDEDEVDNKDEDEVDNKDENEVDNKDENEDDNKDEDGTELNQNVANTQYSQGEVNSSGQDPVALFAIVFCFT